MSSANDTATLYGEDISPYVDVTSTVRTDKQQEWLKDGPPGNWGTIAPAINRFRAYCDRMVNSRQLLRILGDRSVDQTAPSITHTADAKLLVSYCVEDSYKNNSCCCRLKLHVLNDDDRPDCTFITRMEDTEAGPTVTVKCDPRRVQGANFLVWLALYRTVVLDNVCDFVVYEYDLVRGITVVDLLVAIAILECHTGISVRVTVVISPGLTPKTWSFRYSLRSMVRRIADRAQGQDQGPAISRATAGPSQAQITMKEFIDCMYWMAWACRGVTGQSSQYDLTQSLELPGYVKFVRPYNKLTMPWRGASEDEKSVYAADEKRAKLLLQPS